MNQLAQAALLIGLGILIMRIWAVIWPKRFIASIREHVLSHDNTHIQFFAFTRAVIGGFLLYMIWEHVDWMRTLTATSALAIAASGTLALFMPGLARSVMKAILGQSRTAIRIVNLLLCVLAAYLIMFGWNNL